MKLSWSEGCEAESKAQDRAEWRSIVGGGRPVLRQELKGKEEEEDMSPEVDKIWRKHRNPVP